MGFSPQQAGLVDTYVTVLDLLAHANYTFEVEAVNGVSDLSRTQRLFAAVSIATSQAGKQTAWLENGLASVEIQLESSPPSPHLLLINSFFITFVKFVELSYSTAVCGLELLL